MNMSFVVPLNNRTKCVEPMNSTADEIKQINIRVSALENKVQELTTLLLGKKTVDREIVLKKQLDRYGIQRVVKVKE